MYIVVAAVVVVEGRNGDADDDRKDSKRQFRAEIRIGV